MESREILVANTKTQQRTKITTDATTVGELKTALANAGIDYNGMSFTEGISRVSLIDDNSMLPQNLMYKGNVTNNLVILLTNTTKNIASGVGTRKDAYDIIRGNELQSAVQEYYKRNYTNVPTAELWWFIENGTNVDTSEPEDKDEEMEDEAEEEVKDAPIVNSFVENVYAQIKLLAKAELFTSEEVKALSELTAELSDRLYEIENNSIKVGNVNITEDDIDKMLSAYL